MKCLSVRQPWALLVCIGAKTIENRSWNTRYRGEVAIHASGYKNALKHYMEQDTWDTSLSDLCAFGAIIGLAELFDSVPFEERVWDDPCAEGPVCLRFQNAKLFRKPIPHKGRVNLCKLPDDVLRQVEESKMDLIDVESSELLDRCLRVFPLGKIPKAFLPREPPWWSP